MSDVYSCVATGTAVENKAMDLVELDKFNRDQHAVVDGKRHCVVYFSSFIDLRGVAACLYARVRTEISSDLCLLPLVSCAMCLRCELHKD